MMANSYDALRQCTAEAQLMHYRSTALHMLLKHCIASALLMHCR